MPPPDDLVVKRLYGCGLRVSEGLQLRVHGVNVAAGVFASHDGKGGKDRTVPLPDPILPELRAQLDAWQELHQRDLERNYAGVFLVNALESTYTPAAQECICQWFFPAKPRTSGQKTEAYRREHMQPTHRQQAIQDAVGNARLYTRASAHPFRHSFARHWLQANDDIRTIQE